MDFVVTTPSGGQESHTVPIRPGETWETAADNFFHRYPQFERKTTKLSLFDSDGNPITLRPDSSVYIGVKEAIQQRRKVSFGFEGSSIGADWSLVENSKDSAMLRKSCLIFVACSLSRGCKLLWRRLLARSQHVIAWTWKRANALLFQCTRCSVGRSKASPTALNAGKNSATLLM